MQKQFDEKEAAMTSKLDAKMAEAAQLKSQVQVKLRKLNESKTELETKLSKELKTAQVHNLTQKIERKERVVKQMETQQKRLDGLAQFSKDMRSQHE